MYSKIRISKQIQNSNAVMFKTGETIQK